VVPYSFSPDGTVLAYYEQAVDTGWDLWTIRIDSTDLDHPKAGKQELFLRTPANERYPSFSPDGRWVAYESDESGQSEIYVRSFHASNGRSQISAGGGNYPIWSRTNRQLFYESPANYIMMIDYVADGDSFVPTKPRIWSTVQIDEKSLLPHFDLHPDGQRFAVFPRAEANDADKSSVHVTFLLNFFDELRRKVPVGK
jgi:serine/threonine-protein kinase